MGIKEEPDMATLNHGQRKQASDKNTLPAFFYGLGTIADLLESIQDAAKEVQD